MNEYFRPLVQIDPLRPECAQLIAGGWGWFTHVERLARGVPPLLLRANEIPDDVVKVISAPRGDIAGMSMKQPRLMGILNVTPDSFSDGGKFLDPGVAVSHALEMQKHGADILDIGGESTRPGAKIVPVDQEISRTAPVIRALRDQSDIAISIDTRKAGVARAASEAGATIINDVSALSFDPALGEFTANSNLPICLMHALGDPETMQDAPHYDNVVLDVYDYLHDRIEVAMSAGIKRSQIVVDPGIGFGKTLDHNLALLRNLSLFHGLGCPILLGASRKRFIGTLSNTSAPQERAMGSLGVTLAAMSQGVQIHRVHDIKETKQAQSLWAAVKGMDTQ